MEEINRKFCFLSDPVLMPVHSGLVQCPLWVWHTRALKQPSVRGANGEHSCHGQCASGLSEGWAGPVTGGAGPWGRPMGRVLDGTGPPISTEHTAPRHHRPLPTFLPKTDRGCGISQPCLRDWPWHIWQPRRPAPQASYRAGCAQRPGGKGSASGSQHGPGYQAGHRAECLGLL